MKKIFVYIGSGKGINSHTFIYIDKILLGVKDIYKSELEIKIFTPKNSKIKHCIGCLNCFYNGVCPFDELDDMKNLKSEMLLADIIIFGSPIYGANVSGDTKVFFDRISYWYHLLTLRGKSSLFILTSCGNGIHFASNFANFIMCFLGLHIIDVYNISIFSTQQINTDNFIKEKINQTAIILVDYLNGKKRVQSCKSLETVFLSMKKYIETLANTNSFEYSYWKQNGLLNCTTFTDVLKNIKKHD